jgi:hypothetical protein
MSYKLIGSTALVTLLAFGCSTQTEMPENEEIISVDEALSASAFVGHYDPSGGSDWYDFENVEIVRSGRKLKIKIDYDSYWIDGIEEELSRTESGAYVFTTGYLGGECDDEGCSYIDKISGVVYAKRVRGVEKAAVKLTITRNYPYPLSADDPSGEDNEPWRGMRR